MEPGAKGTRRSSECAREAQVVEEEHVANEPPSKDVLRAELVFLALMTVSVLAGAALWPAAQVLVDAKLAFWEPRYFVVVPMIAMAFGFCVAIEYRPFAGRSCFAFFCEGQIVESHGIIRLGLQR